ncbi:unnamed protein product [Ixodes persulcatus]
MDQQAQNFVQKMARARIQQEYKGTTMKASSSAGWTIKSVPPAMFCEVEFPPLCSPAASAPSLPLASAAPSLESTCAPSEAAADQEATWAEMSKSAGSPVPGACMASELGLDRSQPVVTYGKAERRHRRGKPSDVPVN